MEMGFGELGFHQAGISAPIAFDENDKKIGRQSGIACDKFHVIHQADILEPTLGLAFGIHYSFDAPKGHRYLVETVTIFPESGICTKGNSSVLKKYARHQQYYYGKDDSFTGYRLEDECELVEGEWTFQVYVDGILMLERTIILIRHYAKQHYFINYHYPTSHFVINTNKAVEDNS